MRPNRLNVPQNDARSFDLRHEFVPYFTNPWHFHPEIELNHVISGAGTRFIGNCIERFESGEVILIGKNLPHYWKNDNIYYQPDSGVMSEAMVVRFSEDFVGKDFFQLPETSAIATLLDKAAAGIKLLEPLRSEIAAQLQTLIRMEGFEQLMFLMLIMHRMAVSPHLQPLSTPYAPGRSLAKNSNRLSQVKAYLHEHFTGEIFLNEVADLANMNESAFCRYFKSQTGQTLIQYVTDLRVRYACELLIKSEESVTQICFQVGFENVSHFIHAFKKLRGQTPFEFKKGKQPAYLPSFTPKEM
ncbi:AraC family transcriptional regulator [Dyadobacter sp. CY107]|uniref:AraC family transcriptional regulator n=1 Tax=Dyadobacter fanqingshengii TaxID=2906443 RepID=UPI001F2839AC|nr:AraC family transcriptional regulator [Dyadobacter fanqingshengii]MCF2505766.1 AraC family transcriptional regulator [Dyadobacter fanqingshengii]